MVDLTMEEERFKTDFAVQLERRCQQWIDVDEY